MLGGLLIMGLLGTVVGVGLALASKIFYVYIDPKIEAIEEALPGANCGGCGLPGCSANASAIVAGKTSASSCVAGGPEIAAEIAMIMGVTLEEKEPDIARPGCSYGVQDADLKYVYEGIRDCRAAMLLNGGSKVCPIGCLGLGTCAQACPFGALSMGPDNLPVVDVEACTGCGTCERVCPKHIITLTSYSRRIQAEHTTDECTAPCQRACPAGIDIPGYIAKIRDGDFSSAIRTIKETNPFPSICGRICVHPCEYECRRNLVDEPVAINHLKRFVADYEWNSGERFHIPRAPETGRRIAVVGGGAEGLTAAYLLNRLGHDIMVYEATSQLGGLLRAGIAENRLPRDVLDWEIDGILDAGVKVETGISLGRDFTVESLLKQGFSAVLLAIGGWDTRISEGVKGDDALSPLPGVHLLLDYLLKQRTGPKAAPGKDVMILGGGNAALESAISLLELGAEHVYVVFRGSRDSLLLSEGEVQRAEEKGVKLLFGSVLTKMWGEGTKLTYVEIENPSYGEGREPEGKSLHLHVDALLLGSGRFPELIYAPRTENAQEEERSESAESVLWETVLPYAGPLAKQDAGLFRPGEVTGDYKAVVEAIGSGRRAASSVQRFLADLPVEAPDHMIKSKSRVLSLDRLEPISEEPRQLMPELALEEQMSNPAGEIALGYSEDQALKEARRCLQCGLICYRRVEGKLH